MAVAIGLATCLPGASRADAHAVLRSTTPAAGESLDAAPKEVVLQLTETALAVGTVVRVTSPEGSVVSAGKARVVGDEVYQAMSASPVAGTYRVDWRVTSSDGHPVSDSFTFTVASASPEPETTASAAPPAATGPPESPGTASGHHGAGAHAGDGLEFLHVAGVVVILLLGAFGCALSLRRAHPPSLTDAAPPA